MGGLPFSKDKNGGMEGVGKRGGWAEGLGEEEGGCTVIRLGKLMFKD